MKRLKVLGLLALSFTLMSCKKEVKNVIVTEDTSQNPTIIIDDSQREIPGLLVNEEGSLIDITDILNEEDEIWQDIIDVEFYDKTSILIVSHNKKTAEITARLYNPLEGEITANITFMAKKNSAVTVTVSSLGGEVYIEDEVNKTFYIIEEDTKEPKVYDYSDVEYTSKINMSDGNGFYYFKDLDNDLYSYIFESGKSTLEYELEDTIQSPKMYAKTEDNTMIIFEYAMDDGNIYYSFVDLYELTKNDIRKGMYKLKVCNNDYLIIQDATQPYVNLYSRAKPRELTRFALDDIRELQNIELDKTGEYMYSYVPDDKTGDGILRLYDKESAILFNQIMLDKEVFDNIQKVSVSNEQQMAVIAYKDKDLTKILLWNIAIPTDVIDANVGIYYGIEN